ncbi:MAG: zinc-ribbon domain-containing protein [Polyangiaceae bacterium]|nr:zinc-ribbon domain-containing protein [Polyangiaceae bacterium]
MKIQCQSCQAKYTIADEKVAGKVVKIRCKKCGEAIMINGHEMRPSDDVGNMPVYDEASQSDEQWTVNVADGDQRTMTAREIVAEHRAGTINDETYCWKDDMPDWLPLREIESLYSALGAPSHVSLHDEAQPSNSVPPPEMPVPAASEPAESPLSGVSHSNGLGAGFAGSAPTEDTALISAGAPPAEAAPAAAYPSEAESAAGAVAVVAAPAAARRGGGRGQGADLFGNAAHAGGESDVVEAAGGVDAAAMAAAHAEKLTGQRNESSVLFSLSSLTEEKKKNAAPASSRTTATAEGSGLIDIRALGASMGVDESKAKGDTKARVDDIMNLSGGGAFGAPLAAPMLTPSPLEAADQAAASGKSSKGFAILGAAVIIAAAILGGVFLVTRNTTTAPATQTMAPAVTPTNEPPAATPAATAPAENTPAPPTTGPATVPAVPGPKPPARPGAAAAGPKTAAAPAAEAPRPPSGSPDLAGAMAAAAGKPADAPKPAAVNTTAPFNRGAAAAALGNVNVQACKKPDGPTGSGHVIVTFNPDGTVGTAVVDGGPFPGTAVGGCVAGKFRSAHVPAFAGGPQPVGKSFSIN